MSNFYKRLIGLLPARPLLVGTVTAVAGGVATIELPDGGSMQARGNVTAGDHVFFRDGVIEGPAPALTDVVIEI
ncbi:MAG: hypothetical protein ACSLE9_04815 [Burkholderiaceae bacterium]